MITDFSTTHTRDTPVPQTYWQHAGVAVPKSFKLIWFGIVGVIHGILPEIKWMQFYTSSNVLKAAHYLAMCGRHDKELQRIWGDDFTALIEYERKRDKVGW